MKYSGYQATIEFDAEDRVFQGRVAGLRDVATFTGASVDELEQAFRKSVDDYLALCQARGETPGKPIFELSPVWNRILNKAVGPAPSQTSGTATLDMRACLNVLASRRPRRGHGMFEVVRRFFNHLKKPGQPVTVENVSRAMRDGALHDQLLCNPADPSYLIVSDVKLGKRGELVEVLFSRYDDVNQETVNRLSRQTLNQYRGDLEEEWLTAPSARNRRGIVQGCGQTERTAPRRARRRATGSGRNKK